MPEDKDKQHIRDVIEKIKDTEITHQNYKKYSDMVMQKCDTIEIQIENVMSRFKVKKDKYTKYMDAKQMQALIKEERIVPHEAHQVFVEQYELLDEAMTWKLLQYDMLNTLNGKMTVAMSAIRSMDIEKEVLSGVREVNKEYGDMIKEIVNERTKIQDEKFQHFASDINQRFQNLQGQFNLGVVKEYEKMSGVVETMKEQQKEFLQQSKAQPVAPTKLVFPTPTPTSVKNELQCQSCGEYFKNPNMLNAHRKLEHSDENIGG